MIEDVHPLTVTESPGLVRVELGRLSRGREGSLQEAADDLIRRLLALAMAVRSSGFTLTFEFRADLETMNFLYELGEFAAAGRDIRARVFG